MGSYDVIVAFQEVLRKYDVEDLVELRASFCLSNCANGVSVKCEGGKDEKEASAMVVPMEDGFLLRHVTESNVEELFAKHIYPSLEIK